MWFRYSMTMALKCVDSAIFEKKTNLIIVVLVYYNNFIIYTYYIRNRSTTWFDLLRSLKVSMANKKTLFKSSVLSKRCVLVLFSYLLKIGEEPVIVFDKRLTLEIRLSLLFIRIHNVFSVVFFNICIVYWWPWQSFRHFMKGNERQNID